MGYGKKEIAYAALGAAIVGLLLIIVGTMYESSYRGYDCVSSTWVKEKYGGNDSEDYAECREDFAAAYDNSQVLPSIGHGMMLFSIVLMIGANRLEDK
jgi:hypothetical protein